MSGFALAAKERLKSVNSALEAARLEQQAAHEAYLGMDGDPSDPEYVAAYNEVVEAATAIDRKVDDLVQMAANIAGSVSHESPALGSSPIEILTSTPGYEQFRATRSKFREEREVVGREDAIRRFSAGLPIFAAGVTAESLTAIDQRLYPPIAIPMRQPRLLDLIQIGSTDSDTVRYGYQSVNTSTAATKARKTGKLTESTYTWTTADVTVQRAGHYVKAPEETLADQGQFRTLIDGRLSDDLLLKIEDLVYDGQGTGTDFTGIKKAVEDAGYTYAQDTTNFGKLDAIRKGITKVQQNLYGEPNGIMMSPATWEDCELERSTSTAKSGSYLVRGADGLMAEAAVRRLFGLPVVVTALVADDIVLIGDFRRGATLWMRQGVTVEMSNVNEDDFLYNLVTVRAQIRAAFKTVEPKAFCKVTLY